MIEVAALLVHSDPDAALASQNWFIAHTSSPQVHASLLIAEPSVLEHAPPRTRRWKKNRNENKSSQLSFAREHLVTTGCVGSLLLLQEKYCAQKVVLSCSVISSITLSPSISPLPLPPASRSLRLPLKCARATRALRASSLARVTELVHRAHVLPASAHIAVNRRAICARTSTSGDQELEDTQR